MRKVLTAPFFGRSGVTVARELLGKYLVRRSRGREIAFMITETEAYHGRGDKASHAHRGETARNFVMFGPAGRWYVYFTYGMHWMLNVSSGKDGYPSAVLIRALHGVNGPARLTKKLKIDKKLNNKTANSKIGLWIEDRGVRVAKKDIARAPRVGISYAGEWAKKPYRFFLRKNAKK